jgi:hypothetical protein
VLGQQNATPLIKSTPSKLIVPQLVATNKLTQLTSKHSSSRSSVPFPFPPPFVGSPPAMRALHARFMAAAAAAFWRARPICDKNHLSIVCDK